MFPVHPSLFLRVTAKSCQSRFLFAKSRSAFVLVTQIPFWKFEQSAVVDFEGREVGSEG